VDEGTNECGIWLEGVMKECASKWEYEAKESVTNVTLLNAAKAHENIFIGSQHSIRHGNKIQFVLLSHEIHYLN
jgi:hypothetical protein